VKKKLYLLIIVLVTFVLMNCLVFYQTVVNADVLENSLTISHTEFESLDTISCSEKTQIDENSISGVESNNSSINLLSGSEEEIIDITVEEAIDSSNDLLNKNVIKENYEEQKIPNDIEEASSGIEDISEDQIVDNSTEEDSISSEEETLYVQVSSLAVRPAKNSTELLGLLSRGTKITGYREGAWIKTTYNGQLAYIAAKYTDTTPPAVRETLYVQVSSLAVRPAKNSTELLGLLSRGTKITGYREGAWIKTTYNGQLAYIAAKYTSAISPQKRVYLDPGHGGTDSGAYYYGIREADLNLTISHMVKDSLVSLGYKVIMPRTSDTDIDFLDRTIDANSKNPDIFVSIHHNAAPNWPNSTGIETYYYQYYPNWPPKINQEMHNDPNRIQKSASLANSIQNALINDTGAVNRGVQRNTFLVLRETKMPAALIELGFMSNYSELQKLISNSYQRTLANAIVKGIHNHFAE